MAGKLVAVLDGLGHYTQQPQTWAGITIVLAVGGGRRGRRAALRGGACYGIAAVLANFVIKPLVERSRPSGAGEGELGPITTSFPSGHAAADLAFTFGAAQELPALLVPLVAATFPAHWSLVRSNGHHTTDVLMGGIVGLLVAWGMWKLWPVASENDLTEELRPESHAAQKGTGRRGVGPGRSDHLVLPG